MFPQIKTILYTTALGPHTRPVFRFAVSLAKQIDAGIVLLHVVEPLNHSTRFLLDSYLPSDVVDNLHKQNTRGILEKFHQRLETFCEEELGATLEQTTLLSEIRVISGLPCEVILHEADRCNADLIVVGAHSGSRSRTDLLGSTTRRLTLSSKRPVLIVPVADAPDTQWPQALI
ncbi:MAG: universal stress protein [Candidatus Competibacteraceae bacterium]|uniref:UspA domain-containing protein n=1 Tax=Candidatus Contendobacter odensis Run_B_J11 TaxID=1400861 RepID=A0A7U7GCV0_9GAMM|nr:universal stress protein [Candidatus Contendobacter odensis]MBK8534227.1 universal stress protein [Candidatus Competibacteraceae bacterium]MBK8751997.1 universal stress protein [Candidatus Competibacteraceae bacterium]CDH45806.1 putative UspA domain-containing protein [Candidatus Contendobacter odensis Run_B_J11]